MWVSPRNTSGASQMGFVTAEELISRVASAMILDMLKSATWRIAKAIQPVLGSVSV